MRFLLSHLIDQSADRWPEKAAIECRGESLSYRELARQSNRLAHLLVERGVARGDRVAILMNKRVECAIALYGIMKAGAAYVPLDPGAPTDRHAFVIRDCGVRHLISEPRKQKAVEALSRAVELTTVIGCEAPQGNGMTAFSFDALEGFDSAAPPDCGAMEQDLAYILYTSGSTGVPKGIMHSHRSGLAWAEVSADAYRLDAEDRISNYAPLHFDLSTLDYFASALVGATTVMIPEEVTKLASSLCASIAGEALTVFYTVPFALTQMVRSGCVRDSDFSALRWVLFGGEPMPPAQLARLMDDLPATRFCNVYGPTETNGCTHFPLPETWDPERPLPIGETYPNTEALILDADDAEVAPGEVGELVIRAPTLMRGYWGREDLNAVSSFYRQAHCGLPDRFHRTGDLVYRDVDGMLCYVCRKDRQIKSRGCRIDLDEVELALRHCEAVADAAVFSIEDADGHQVIEAAVVQSAEAAAPFDAALRRQLKASLPVYALPRRFAIIAELPRTSTGKVDRVSLARAAVQRIRQDD